MNIPDPVVRPETRALVATFKNKREAAIHYRALLERYEDRTDKSVWPDINHALLERWSRSGLVDIKRRAWLGRFA